MGMATLALVPNTTAPTRTASVPIVIWSTRLHASSSIWKKAAKSVGPHSVDGNFNSIALDFALTRSKQCCSAVFVLPNYLFRGSKRVLCSSSEMKLCLETRCCHTTFAIRVPGTLRLLCNVSSIRAFVRWLCKNYKERVGIKITSYQSARCFTSSYLQKLCHGWKDRWNWLIQEYC